MKKFLLSVLGLLVIDEQKVRLTRAGLLVSDRIFLDFF